MIINKTKIMLDIIADTQEKLDKFIDTLERDLSEKANYQDVKIGEIDISTALCRKIEKIYKITFEVGLTMQDISDFSETGDMLENMKDYYLSRIDYNDADQSEHIINFKIEEVK